MFKYRVKYKNNWNDEMSLTYETDKFFNLYKAVKKSFGEENILEIEPLDEASKLEKDWHFAIHRSNDDDGA